MEGSFVAVADVAAVAMRCVVTQSSSHVVYACVLRMAVAFCMRSGSSFQALQQTAPLLFSLVRYQLLNQRNKEKT